MASDSKPEQARAARTHCWKFNKACIYRQRVSLCMQYQHLTLVHKSPTILEDCKYKSKVTFFSLFGFTYFCIYLYCPSTPLNTHRHTHSLNPTYSSHILASSRTHTPQWDSVSQAHLVAVWIWWEGTFALFSEVLPNMIMVSVPPVFYRSTVRAITQVPSDQSLPGESWKPLKGKPLKSLVR